LFIPIFLLTVVLYSPGEVKNMGKRATALLGGFAYLGLLVSSIAAVVAYPNEGLGFDGTAANYGMGPVYLLVMLGGVLCGDTGAYFAGRTLGNAKLYEKISPKKTWAGAVGGVFSSVGGVLLFTYLLPVSIPTIHCVILGIAFAAFEQTGDLAESLFKRANNIKDSGCILPGHGGMLDRIDGILFAGPIMWCWLHYFA
jgi:phosphatidate cytidylyltransferase